MRMSFRVGPSRAPEWALPYQRESATPRLKSGGTGRQLLSYSADQLVGKLIPDLLWQVDTY